MGGHSKSAETCLLIESAAGFVVCAVKEWSAIASETVGATLSDPAKFNEVVVMRAFYPFQDSEQALANIQAISEGRATEELLHFLQTALVSSKKKKSSSKPKAVKLGVVDPELAKYIVKATDGEVAAFHGKDVFELMRVCRANLQTLIPTLRRSAAVENAPSSVMNSGLGSLTQFQLGLGHSYSRAKVATDPARQDKHCQQAIATIELAEKTTNKFGMRLREWYGWHFPELLKIVNDHKKIAQVALVIGQKENFEFTKASRMELRNLLDGSDALVEQLEQALKMSMGQSISDLDWANIRDAALQTIHWADMKERLASYLTGKMELIAPNLQTLVGDQLGGKLITQAGSITALAKSPASTIQILGAEKALFRALKSRGPTPKYGFIYNSGFIGKASQKNKGRISRYLANKIALASRMDAFGNDPQYGQTLKKQIEDRLHQLTTGA